MKRQKIPDELFAMLAAVDEMAGDEPDGAWWAMLENTVTMWNDEHGTTFDENDTVHAYVRKHAKEQKQSTG